MSRRPVAVTKRPARLSSLLGVAAATVALAAMVDVGAARLVVVVELVGLAIAGLGAAASTRGHRAPGRAIVAVGAVVALAAVPLAFATLPEASVVIAVVPGVVGLFALAMGLLPVRGTGSRGLVKLGTALAFVAVLAAGLFRLSPSNRLLASVGLVVVAWDVSDHAIGIGEHLGSRATTRRLEAVHAGGSLVVAAIGVAVASAVAGLSVASLPLEGFVLLLGAVITLTLALHG